VLPSKAGQQTPTLSEAQLRATDDCGAGEWSRSGSQCIEEIARSRAELDEAWRRYVRAQEQALSAFATVQRVVQKPLERPPLERAPPAFEQLERSLRGLQRLPALSKSCIACMEKLTPCEGVWVSKRMLGVTNPDTVDQNVVICTQCAIERYAVRLVGFAVDGATI
jgi:hypothetical protein